MSKERWFHLVLAVVAVVAPLVSAEVVLRMNGFIPWRPFQPPANEPQLLQPDPVLGWRGKPGRHVFPGYSPEVERITMTLEPDGSRFTGDGPANPRARVAILGDSFAIGWGISDEETFAWKLQQLLPDLRVTNHATAGYGTCQSLQMLREIVAREPPPDLILYGFYDDHLRRNVVDYPSLYTLERRSRRTSRYCQIDARGRLVEHPPELRGDWPLIKSLATVYFLQQRYELYRRSRRMKQVWPVMEAIVAEMDRVARARGSRLVFASLLCRPRPFRRMAKILEARGIPFLDCNRFLRPEWIVQGEGHPNGLMHTEWAQCLVRALPALLERR